MSYQTRTLDDVIGSVRNAEGECVVLIGAGCSLSAGIPLAHSLVAEIKEQHPEAYNRALKLANGTPSYNAVMEQLSPNERQRLLNKHIEEATVNWAHLALAQLFLNKKINRVLTVNFDPLLVKACSLVNFYPAIYDLAGTDSFKSHRIAPQSVFYLNGQHTGFVTLNAEDELKVHRKRLSAIVEDTGVRRVWIVVGYSGEADPLLEILAEKDTFDGDLYWLGRSAEPKTHLQESGLLHKDKRTFYVGGQDADMCLTELAQKLECFPPDILIKPFDHLQSVVKNINFDTGGEAAKAIRSRLLSSLSKAADEDDSDENSILNDAERWMLTGEFEKVIQAFNALDAVEKLADIVDLASWAYVMQGNQLLDEAKAVAQDNLSLARSLWQQAGEKYAQALSVKADMHEAANNWGAVLTDEAKAVAQDNLSLARSLWQQAGEKYAQALSIKADMHEAANNWGNALADEAKAVAQDNLSLARTLWQQASEKFAQALSIKADMHEAANNWGIAVADEAKAVVQSDLSLGRSLWQQAGERYSQALSINADMHEAANNWGIALANEAKAVAQSDLSLGRTLWQRAGEKFAQALSIKADMHEAANNWGIALANEAKAVAQSDLSLGRTLWQQAGEKYAQALSIKDDKHEAANNWGIALADEANAVAKIDSGEAHGLWQQARELLEKHIEYAPIRIAYNLACVYSCLGEVEKSFDHLEIARQNHKLPSHWLDDSDLDNVRKTELYKAWYKKHFG